MGIVVWGSWWLMRPERIIVVPSAIDQIVRILVPKETLDVV